MSRAAIVILNWNGVEMLRRFLPGVIAATPSWARVVVADNGSTDTSCRYVEEHFPMVQLLRLGQNYGFAEGYNRALAQLDEEIFVLLNSDVATPEGWLEPLVASLDRHPEAAAVGPKLRSERMPDYFEYAGASGGFIDFFGYPFCRGRILQQIEQDHGQYDDEREVFWISGAALCCRAHCFRALGGFDASYFAHMEEIDLAWRMQLAGWTLRIVPQSEVFHVGGATLSAESPWKIYLNHRNNLRMLFKCSTSFQRWVVALVRPFTDLLAAFSYLAKGNRAAFRGVFRAWRDFLREHRRLSEQRREVRANRKKNPVGIYRGSILLRYLFGYRRFDNLI